MAAPITPGATIRGFRGFSAGYFGPQLIRDLPLIQRYYAALPGDPYGPGRRRAYRKLERETVNGELRLAQDQGYSQTYAANRTDGGKRREFAPMDDALYELL